MKTISHYYDYVVDDDDDDYYSYYSEDVIILNIIAKPFLYLYKQDSIHL
jgi:hypothetical protein